LIHETSPYLLQHAHNPVDWHAWSEEAFAEARANNKPLLLSIGYSACHWCHVMEHESFENEAIARLMNEHFVCIKVDREERPDLDQIYMNAVQMMTQHGGWPMTVFLTPDGVPFYGGTYFPPADRYNMPGFPGAAELSRRVPRPAGQRHPYRCSAPRRTATMNLAESHEPLTSDLPDAAQRAIARTTIPRTVAWQCTGFSLDEPPSFSCEPTTELASRVHSKSSVTPASEWLKAASTISLAVASIATQPTLSGWCRTSKDAL
jgi:uncharacterized protein YyaL (SSP411 family)